jgi:hypothetical protein
MSRHSKTVLAATAAVLVTLVLAPGALAVAPVKLVLTSHFGREVNLTEVNAKGGPALEDLCTIESKNECQPGTPSSTAGGFEYPEDVAGAPNGNVYVDDRGNDRVQELTANGEFILAFGRKVNKTTGGNVCTRVSGDTCGAGEPGTGAEALDEPESVTVDSATGNVYVLDYNNWRVDEYTASGEFLLMFGKEVNKHGGDICTRAEAGECQSGVQGASENTEKTAFNVAPGRGDLLAVGGGPEHLLYVGDEHRIQEFNEKGEPTSEIVLPAAVTTPGTSISAIAVDATTEAVYVVYEQESVIREYNTKGEETKHFEILPREAGKPVMISAITLDLSGHLAVWAYEDAESQASAVEIGTLYEVSDGRMITQFTTPDFLYTPVQRAVTGIGFNGSGELYAVLIGQHEVWSYTPKHVAELVSEPAGCVAGAERESDVTLDCSLRGKIDPWGVSDTEAWFQWGRSPGLGQETGPQPVENTTKPPVEGEEESFVGVSAVVPGVRPNEAGFYYRVVGRDQNLPAPELVRGETLSFTTPRVAPHVIGAPSAPFIRSSSAVMFGQLNPENAQSEYYFEYIPASRGALREQCPQGVRSERAHCEGAGVLSTSTASSSVYQKIGATFEATSLQPATVYHYRLVAEDEQEIAGKHEGATTLGAEGTFTTSAAPAPQAATGAASAVAASSATVTGTVDPDGQPATYTFELGDYNGASTRYGVVFSGPAGAGSTPVAETLVLTGLQPGRTYAYRIAVTSGYGTATGEPMLFTTLGLPEVLVSPAPLGMLAVPAIVFPAAARAVPAKRQPKGKAKKKLQRKRRPGRKTGVMKAKK